MTHTVLNGPVGQSSERRIVKIVTPFLIALPRSLVLAVYVALGQLVGLEAE